MCVALVLNVPLSGSASHPLQGNDSPESGTFARWENSFALEGQALAAATNHDATEVIVATLDGFIVLSKVSGLWANLAGAALPAAVRFAHTIAASEDTVAVATNGWYRADSSTTGAVFLYDRLRPNAWSEPTVVVYDVPGGGFGFGQSLALQDGLLYASIVTGGAGNPGAVHVFDRLADRTYEVVDSIHSSTGGTWDGFGTRFVLDGELMVVSAPKRTVAGVAEGAFDVFERTTSGWVQRQTIRPPPGYSFYRVPSPHFAEIHDFDLDGGVFAIGQSHFDGDRGRVLVYEWNGQQFVLDAELEAPDPAPGQSFGTTVAVEAGRIVGDIRNRPFVPDGSLAPHRPGLLVFSPDGGSWQQVAEAWSPTGSSAGMGGALAITGTLLFAGGPQVDFFRIGTTEDHVWEASESIGRLALIGVCAGSNPAQEIVC